jgi:Protein of unknown function (DUF2971)
LLVYKYRDGNINKLEGEEYSNFERDLRSIERNYFWGTYYKDLNDPCEGLISNRFTTFIQLLGKKETRESNNLRCAFEKFLLQIEKIGIYSLSKTYKDALLWAHYGNSHKGFCIEYDLDLLSKNYNHNFNVKYNKNIPEIGIADIANKRERYKIVNKAFGYKYRGWRFEQEYRLITNDLGINNYDFKALKSIYFGLRMDNEQKTKIMNSLKGRGINYFQVEHVKKSYHFKAKPIKDINCTEITYLKQIPSKVTGNIPINFKIIKQDYWVIRGKGNIEIELEKVINKKELLWLAELIKENLFFNAEFVIMFHYIKNKDRGIAWATTHYKDGKIDININGLFE